MKLRLNFSSEHGCYKYQKNLYQQQYKNDNTQNVLKIFLFFFVWVFGAIQVAFTIKQVIFKSLFLTVHHEEKDSL